MPAKKKPDPVRGERINIVKGAYKGKKGWIDKGWDTNSASVHVIIDRGQAASGDTDPSNRACIRKTSVMTDPGEPTSIEAMVLQDEAVASALAELGRVVAMCGVERKDDAVLLELAKAAQNNMIFQIQCQEEKGDRARYSRTALKVFKMKLNQRKRRGSGENNVVMENVPK